MVWPRRQIPSDLKIWWNLEGVWRVTLCARPYGGRSSLVAMAKLAEALQEATAIAKEGDSVLFDSRLAKCAGPIDKSRALMIA